jgi:glutamate N-acetyltransferase / amino-acid N-acetyltransferase
VVIQQHFQFFFTTYFSLMTTSTIYPIAGIKIATICAKIKQTQRDDLVLFEIAPNSHCAAVFTQNAFCAAPVTVARQHLQVTFPRYLLINSGNANAGMGELGLRGARACCQTVADHAGCQMTEVLPFSTGVIGQELPVAKIQAVIPILLQTLVAESWELAARAIMTTDTVPKIFSKQLKLHNKTVNLTGIAKGAGMIKPDMATLLAFLATDAQLPPALLQNCLNSAVNSSFNRISIDGDTSTNDACVLVATGHSGVTIDSEQQADFEIFNSAVVEMCTALAQAIVRDGEGATKFITIQVEQGKTEAECLAVAYTVAHSPLVKTAFFASDANWGRILAAIGRSGLENFEIDAVQIFIGDVCIVNNGERATSYTEAQGQQVMAETDITIRIFLGRGQQQVEVWTCDFSYDYVKINAEYRT